ncbi:Serine/arginine-rich splicing factor 2 [Anabarilius grahami]|uniref:Serine/arginine-rich splicing factor 2 n=1 Tax=Anabarilius grahami TaxID=495550 RepID=A0A3N0XP52_ANAGA|nr:Serine/arginine-rich splicing factor 2 [Anabarilius grahami]
MSYGRPPPDVEGMTSLKVDNLTYRTSPETLRRVFEKYGRVGDVYIPRDRYTKESRGFAFVRFHDKRDAEDAMDAMDGALLDGRELRVQMARYGRPPDSHYSRRGAPPRRLNKSLYVRCKFEALRPQAVVLGAGGTAGPGAGAGPVPVAGLVTADPGQGPTPVPVLGPVPKPAHHAEASPKLLPGPAQGLSPSLALGVLLPGQTKDPNQDPDRQADPSLQRILEPLLNREM